MPKVKQFLKGKKKESKHAAKAPTTADEYLAAGVDFEEAGEKWRGGDAAKSARFFVRAIDCYEEALKKFPTSFDLAYNKARVQYELTQHPKLRGQLPGSLMELLQIALESSRYALSLNQDNADVLFNTAQILGSLAEYISSSSEVTDLEPLRLLEESLELFQRCLALQEYQYTESQALAQEAMDTNDPGPEDGGLPLSSEPSASSDMDASSEQEDDRWASIVEPVTNESLLDTLMAQLEVLTLLCGFVAGDDGKGVSFIEEYSSSLLTLKLPTYLKGASPETIISASIASAAFNSALADANFQCGRTALATYWQVLESSWGAIDLSHHPEGLASAAEAMITYSTALRSHPDSQQPAFLSARWKALSSAQEALTNASKLPAVENLAKIHLIRGDVDILRFQLGQGKHVFDAAVKSASVLCKNAEKYYRGAKALAASAGEGGIATEAGIKEGLAKTYGGEQKGLSDAVKEIREQVGREVLKDSFEDGLVDEEQLRAMGIQGV